MRRLAESACGPSSRVPLRHQSTLPSRHASRQAAMPGLPGRSPVGRLCAPRRVLHARLLRTGLCTLRSSPALRPGHPPKRKTTPDHGCRPRIPTASSPPLRRPTGAAPAHSDAIGHPLLLRLARFTMPHRAHAANATVVDMPGLIVRAATGPLSVAFLPTARSAPSPDDRGHGARSAAIALPSDGG